MRYFTKEWNRLIDTIDESLTTLPYDDASEEAISALYQKQLADYIAEDRKQYNTPPRKLSRNAKAAGFPGSGFDFEHWDFIEGCHNDVVLWRHPLEPEESVAAFNRSFEEETELFNKRPAYNPAPAVELFEGMFEGRMESAKELPSFVTEAVDLRIVALGYLPKALLTQYRAYCVTVQKQFDDIVEAGDQAFARENLPEEIVDSVFIHDSALLGMDEEKGNLILTAELDGWFPEGETAYRKITFFNAKLIENEKTLLEAENAYFLSTEVYRIPEKGYEVHFLFTVYPGEYAYLTLQCSDIQSEVLKEFQ